MFDCLISLTASIIFDDDTTHGCRVDFRNGGMITRFVYVVTITDSQRYFIIKVPSRKITYAAFGITDIFDKKCREAVLARFTFCGKAEVVEIIMETYRIMLDQPDDGDSANMYTSNIIVSRGVLRTLYLQDELRKYAWALQLG